MTPPLRVLILDLLLQPLPIYQFSDSNMLCLKLRVMTPFPCTVSDLHKPAISKKCRITIIETLMISKTISKGIGFKKCCSLS